MSVVKEYQVGSVSDILAKSGDSTAAYDPLLCDIFGSNKYKITKSPLINTVTDTKVNKKIKTEKKGTSEDKEIKGAKTIRVQEKRKIKETETNDDDDHGPKNKKKKPLKFKQFKSHKVNDEIIEEFEREFKLDGVKAEQEDDDDDSDSDEADDNESKKNTEVKEEESADNKAKKKFANFELNTPKEKNAEHESRTVFVGNVPTSLKEKQLKKLFKPFGTVEAIRFRGGTGEKYYELKKVAINNKKKLNPNQYNLLAYIRFKTREEAQKAVELNGHEIQEHHLVVDLADNKSRDNKRTVFIGNIPIKIHDDEVWNFFQTCGKVHSVRIIRNRLTGLSRGFGYVLFEEQDSVALALKKNGENFQGRPIRVSKAVKKLKKPKVMNDTQKRKLGNLMKAKKNNESSNNNNNKPQGKSANALRRLEQKKKKQQALTSEDKFSGDRVAERQKKHNSKPNRGEQKKARIASQLTGLSTTQVKKTHEKLNLQKKQTIKKKRF